MSDSEEENAVAPPRGTGARMCEKKKMILEKILTHALFNSNGFQKRIVSVKASRRAKTDMFQNTEGIVLDSETEMVRVTHC